jgi:hypothetical protein
MPSSHMKIYIVSEDLMIIVCGSMQEWHNKVSGYKNVGVSVLSMPHFECYVGVYDYDLDSTIKLSFCAAVAEVPSDSWGTQV